jgi:4-hydroxybenzoate polyprenyltransferase
MHIPIDVSAARSLRWLDFIRSEMILYWRFTRYDISATVIPGLLFLLAA